MAQWHVPPQIGNKPTRSNNRSSAHWDRRAAHFDEDFGHSIRTAAERAAWDRILDLTLPGADALEALDIGCGTDGVRIHFPSAASRCVSWELP